MAEDIRITEEEHQILSGIQQQFTRLANQLGVLKIQEVLLDKEITLASEQIHLLEQSRVQAIQQLQSKYGTGVLDATTGIITPEIS